MGCSSLKYGYREFSPTTSWWVPPVLSATWGSTDHHNTAGSSLSLSLIFVTCCPSGTRCDGWCNKGHILQLYLAGFQLEWQWLLFISVCFSYLNGLLAPKMKTLSALLEWCSFFYGTQKGICFIHTGESQWGLMLFWTPLTFIACSKIIETKRNSNL